MHKYQPVITIHKMSSEPANLLPVCTFEPKETEFIAVTAYQRYFSVVYSVEHMCNKCYFSENIIKLKVQHNPFAKGFREGSVRKRSLSNSPGSPPRSTLLTVCFLSFHSGAHFRI